MRKKATLSLVKNINYNLIWDHYLSHNTASIPMISEAIGLSLPTVTRAIDFGQKINMVLPADIAKSTGGRKAQLYKLNGDYCHFLNILFDNNAYFYQVTDFTGKILQSDKIDGSSDDAIFDLSEIIKVKLAAYPLIKKIAIALPGIYHGGEVIECWQFPSLNGVNIEKILSDRFKLPIQVQNNVKIMTLAADKYVADFEQKTIVCYQFGHTGFGAGVIIDGKLLNGACGAAGEIGFNFLGAELPEDKGFYAKQLRMLWTVLNPEVVICYSGDKDVSAAAMVEEAKTNTSKVFHSDIIEAPDYIADCMYGLNFVCTEACRNDLDKL